MPREPVPVEPTEPHCYFCWTTRSDLIEAPPRNPTPIVVDSGSAVVCRDCRTKARQRPATLVSTYRPERHIVVDGSPPDPRIAVGQVVEQQYSTVAMRAALAVETDPWRYLAILNDRLVQGENTQDRVDEAQQYRQRFTDLLTTMPEAGELHALVTRGQPVFGYDSREVEKQIRTARATDLAVERRIIEEPDLWPEPVDGAAVADAIAAKFHEYVKLLAEQADYATLWCFFAHAIDAFDISPILGVESPTPRCGKSTLVSMIGRLCRRSLRCSNISGAATYRAIEKWNPTLVIDEGDTFLTDKRNEDLRGIIDSGHTREFAYVVRAGSSEEGHEPRVYSTWCAKVVGLIGNLPRTIHDRTIRIRLKRKKASDTVHKLRRHHLDTLRPLHRQIARWVSDHHDALHVQREPLDLDLDDDRAADNWDVLVFIADMLGGSWPQRARQAMVALSGGAARAEETIGVELLADVRRLFSPEYPTTKIYTDELLKWLTCDPERPWAAWSRGKSLNARQLARLLSAFDIFPKTVRIAKTTGKGYDKDDFADAWSRYLPPVSPSVPPQEIVTTSQPASLQAISTETDPLHDLARDGSQNGISPSIYAGSDGVTAKSPPTEGRTGVTQPLRQPVPRREPVPTNGVVQEPAA
jgi:Protein of unknown function (DUF3631)